MDILRVALVAFRAEFGKKQANLDRIVYWMDQAAGAGAHLVCFPEIALQGYCSVAEVVRGLAEPPDGPSCRVIAERARRLQISVSLGMSLAENRKVFNSQVFIGPEKYLGAQHKIHLCGVDRVYDLASSWTVFELAGWRVGATICFDSEFPETARILALKGADLLLMSFCNGRRNYRNQPAKPGEWKAEHMPFIPSRAYDNRIFVVGVNHAGKVEDTEGIAVANPDGRADVVEWAPRGTVHSWTGYAFAIDPRGQLIAETDPQDCSEKMLVADLDRAKLADSRYPIEVKLPDATVRGDFVSVRRVDAFEGLLDSRLARRSTEEA